MKGVRCLRRLVSRVTTGPPRLHRFLVDFDARQPIQGQEPQLVATLHVWNGKFLLEFRGRGFRDALALSVTNSVEMLHLLRLLM